MHLTVVGLCDTIIHYNNINITLLLASKALSPLYLINSLHWEVIPWQHFSMSQVQWKGVLGNPLGNPLRSGEAGAGYEVFSSENMPDVILQPAIYIQYYQATLLNCACFISCSPIVSTSSATLRLHPLVITHLYTCSTKVTQTSLVYICHTHTHTHSFIYNIMMTECSLFTLATCFSFTLNSPLFIQPFTHTC